MDHLLRQRFNKPELLELAGDTAEGVTLPGLTKYRSLLKRESPSESSFQATLGKKSHEAHSSLRSYALLFSDVPHNGHVCPYPDVYTRQFRWVMDSAVELDGGTPSDIMIVVHVGPFARWLNEPMNRDYFIRQLAAARENRLAVFRVWLIPPAPPKGAYTPEDYAFVAYGNKVTQGNGIASALKEANIPCDTYSEVVRAILQPNAQSGDPLPHYSSIVLTYSMVARLAGRDDEQCRQRVKHALDHDYKQDKRFNAFVDTCLAKTDRSAGDLSACCDYVLRSLESTELEYRLFVGCAIRRRGDKEEHLLCGYRGDNRREAVVLLSDSAREIPEHIGCVARFATHLARESELTPGSALRCLQVTKPGTLRTFVESELGKVK